MSEQTPRSEPPQYNREQVIGAFRKFPQRGINNPEDLSESDPEVIGANNILDAWTRQAQDRTQKLATPAANLEFTFDRSTIFVDAGFSDPDYLDEVAHDWLAQDLQEAEDQGLADMASKIQAKIAEIEAKLLEVFRANFETGIDEMLEMADFLFDRPKPPDPYSMGFDERAVDELSDEEKAVAQQVIYRKFGLTPDKLDEARVRTYATQAPEDAKVPGEIKAEMFRTNREDIFLQELTFQDGSKSWVIGPDQNI